MEEAKSTTKNQDVTVNAKKRLTARQCMEIIRNLAKGQGFYSYLYANLKNLQRNDPDKFKAAMQIFEKQGFNDQVDLVLFLET